MTTPTAQSGPSAAVASKATQPAATGAGEGGDHG